MLWMRCRQRDLVNTSGRGITSYGSPEYTGIDWHSILLPLTSARQHSNGRRRGELCIYRKSGGDKELEVDWEWWMLIDDTVCPELHNGLVSQAFCTTANRVWLLPLILYSRVCMCVCVCAIKSALELLNQSLYACFILSAFVMNSENLPQNAGEMRHLIWNKHYHKFFVKAKT